MIIFINLLIIYIINPGIALSINPSLNITGNTVQTVFEQVLHPFYRFYLNPGTTNVHIFLHFSIFDTLFQKLQKNIIKTEVIKSTRA